MIRFLSRQLSCLAVVAVTFVLAKAATAQDVPLGIDRPLVTFAVASYEHINGGIETIFSVADRPELANLVDGFIANVGDLKGWDRERPFGAMLLLNPGIAPEPVLVGFVPVKDIETMRESYESGLFRVQDSAEHEGLYELVMPEGNTLLFRIVGDYAYFSKQPESLNRKFVSPHLWLKPWSDKYDAWTTVHFSHVPEGLRTIVIDYLRASAQEKLKRRDGESDVEYEARQAASNAVMDGFEQIATDGETLTAGYRIEREATALSAEVVLQAKANTELAASLNGMAAQSDRFAALAPEGHPLQLSTSWVMCDSVASMLQRALEIGHVEGREKSADKPLERAVVDSIHSLIKSTVDGRHINGVMRVSGHPPAQFNLVGAMHFADGGDLDTAMQAVYSAVVAGSDDATVTVGVDSHQGYDIHRLTPKKYQEAAVLLYGREAALYVAKVDDDLFYAFGGSKALDELKALIDSVTASAGQEATAAEGRIFEFSFNLSNWLMFIPQENPEASQAARQAFASGGDGLGVRVQQIENGTQVRISLGKGYLRLVGLLIAGAIDERRN